MREEKKHILNEVLRLLSEKYPIGLYEYLFKHRSSLYMQLIDLEERIDQAFLYETVGDLKAVLREYWTFHMTAIKEFKQIGELSLNLSQARQEMVEERIRA